MKRLILAIAVLFAGVAHADTPIITHSKVVEVTPTVETSAYASGDQVGETLTFTGAVRGHSYSAVVEKVTVTDLADQGVDLELILFDTSFTEGTDNSALDIGDADLVNVACVIPITNHFSYVDNGVSTSNTVRCPFRLAVGTQDITGILVSRGAPTYASTSDITIRLHLLQD